MTGADRLGSWPASDPDRELADDPTFVPEPQVWPDPAAGPWPRRRRPADLRPPAPRDDAAWPGPPGPAPGPPGPPPARSPAGDEGPATRAWSMFDDPEDSGPSTAAWAALNEAEEPAEPSGWDDIPQPEPWPFTGPAADGAQGATGAQARPPRPGAGPDRPTPPHAWADPAGTTHVPGHSTTHVPGHDQSGWGSADHDRPVPSEWGRSIDQDAPAAWRQVDHRGRPPQTGAAPGGQHALGVSDPSRTGTGHRGASGVGRAQRRRAASGRGARERKIWPRRAAIFAAVVVVMVVSWFWIFPWLETVLPAEY
jgi:hypothetical protein